MSRQSENAGSPGESGGSYGQHTDPAPEDESDLVTGRDALLSVRNLTTRFDTPEGTVRAVDGVSFEVREGEILGIVGESGCGKSTLARAAIRLLDPTGGEVYYRDEEVTEYSREELRAFRGEVQMIFQDPFASLNPRYSVERTLTEPMRVHDVGDGKRERRDRAADLLERCGLATEHLGRYPHEFSGGQRQRIAIARALAVEPQVLVADEPVSALDVSVQAQILNLLAELKAEMGLSMLFISHDMSVVRRVCDRVAVMYLGEIAEVADTETLFADPRHPYTQAFLFEGAGLGTTDAAALREGTALAADGAYEDAATQFESVAGDADAAGDPDGTDPAIAAHVLAGLAHHWAGADEEAIGHVRAALERDIDAWTPLLVGISALPYGRADRARRDD